jgi:hypothetical protein
MPRGSLAAHAFLPTGQKHRRCNGWPGPGRWTIQIPRPAGIESSESVTNPPGVLQQDRIRAPETREQVRPGGASAG